jgi:hypothetical protein
MVPLGTTSDKSGVIIVIIMKLLIFRGALNIMSTIPEIFNKNLEKIFFYDGKSGLKKAIASPRNFKTARQDIVTRKTY